MMNINKYQKWYDQLIDRARNRTIEGYVERHHIVPKSLGGTNEKSNLVDLTAREHLIAHMLLPRFAENKKPMWQALWCMVHMGEVKLTGRLYEQVKIEFRGICKSLNKGRKRSPETCAKISAVRKGIKLSPETLAKMSAAKKGRKMSPEFCAKMSVVLKGRKMSPEFCAKMSVIQKGKKKSPETITKRQATRAANRALKPLQCSSEHHHQSPVQLT